MIEDWSTGFQSPGEREREKESPLGQERSETLLMAGSVWDFNVAKHASEHPSVRAEETHPPSAVLRSGLEHSRSGL